MSKIPTESSFSSFSKLSTLLAHPSIFPNVFVGFDGFIDEILHVVDKRLTSSTYERLPTIQSFADRIANGSNMSTNMEYVSQQIKMGGNGPLLAHALLNFSVSVMYMGAIGYPHPDEFFHSLKRCEELTCLAPPAITESLEFHDGKIITSKLAALNAITWENILQHCPLPDLISKFERCSYYVFSNWSMILGMNVIWEEFLTQIAPQIHTTEKTVFFDLADPEKRNTTDLLRGLTAIKNFTEAGFRVILSMNLKEACEISEAFGNTIDSYSTADTRALLTTLSKKLRCDCMVIHLVDRACCQHDNSYYEVQGPFCAQPKLTTGAGDNFNAGFLYGITQNLSFIDCLYIGSATSGYYVRNARSPHLHELLDFFDLWKGNPDLI